MVSTFSPGSISISDIEEFALADIFYPTVAQTDQRGTNGLALGVEYRGLERHMDASFHETPILTESGPPATYGRHSCRPGA
jgi:hypothetical protein